jgi:hypothetical protein
MIENKLLNIQQISTGIKRVARKAQKSKYGGREKSVS